MEFVQRAANPWGEDILVRASWDVLWLVVIASIVFLLIHQVLRRRWIGKEAAAAAASAGETGHVARHSLPSRIFHWVMAASMLVLLFTGFLPIVGIEFSWVAIHWWAGLALLACIVFHIVHALARGTLREVWVGPSDVRDWWRGMMTAVGSSGPEPRKPGKYPVDNKLYHLAVMVTSLGVVVTGLLMMVRIEQPFFERNPYLFEDGTWGVVFVIHGLSAIALVGLVVAHIYFAILPEKREMTMSMIRGWMQRGFYTSHYDTERWKADDDRS